MMVKLTNLTQLDLDNICIIRETEESRYYESIFKKTKITSLKIKIRCQNIDEFIKQIKFNNIL